MRSILITASLFFVLGCQQEQPAPAASDTQQQATTPATAESSEGVQVVDLRISGENYEPTSVNVRAGVPVRLNVSRDDKPTCGDVLLIPSQNIKRDIPANQVTTIEFTPQQPGDLEFTCGMNMMRGKIVVQQSGV